MDFPQPLVAHEALAMSDPACAETSRWRTVVASRAGRKAPGTGGQNYRVGIEKMAAPQEHRSQDAVRDTAAACHGEAPPDYLGSFVVEGVHKLPDAEVVVDSAAVEVALRQWVSAVLRWTVVLGHDREPLVVVQVAPMPVPVELTGLAIRDMIPVRAPAVLEKARPSELEERMDQIRCLLDHRFGLRYLRVPQARSPQD